MKDLVIIALCILTLWALISWGTGGGALAAERTDRIAAQAHADALATQVAIFKPTPKPCSPALNSYGC